jgi:tetratricopeptide (TPR) repeat protein
MGTGSRSTKSRRRNRRARVLVMLAVALVTGGAIAGRHWLQGPRQNPKRLDLLQAALGEFQAKRYAQAIAILDRRAAETTPIPLDWMLRARVAEAQSRLEEALNHLGHIPDSDPISSQAWLKAGQLELARHRARAADAAFQRSLALNPDQIQAYRELAYLYAVQLRKAECDAQFRALNRRIRMDPTLALAWSQNSCGLWDVPGARKVLIPFVAEDPTDRTSRLALATSYALTGEYDEAEATLRPLPPSDPDALALRVQLAIDRGDVETADQLLREGPEDHARLNLFRGRLAMNGGDPRRAAAYFRAALGKEPADRDSIHGLGVALKRLGDPQSKDFLQIADRHDQLKRTVKDSVVIIRTDRKFFDKLGDICTSLNRREEACAWYRLAIQYDPLDAHAEQALARLDREDPDADAGPDPAQDKRN